jgi:hypothetical protein
MKFCQKLLRKLIPKNPQSDEKWYKISVPGRERIYEAGSMFFGLLDLDPYIISTDQVPDSGLI